MAIRRKKPTDGIRRKAERSFLEKYAQEKKSAPEDRDEEEPVREEPARAAVPRRESAHEPVKKTARAYREKAAEKAARILSRVKTPKAEYGAPRVRLYAAGAAGVLVGVGFILLSTVFARATISVKPLVEDVGVQSLPIILSTASPQLAVAERTIPAELLQFSADAVEEFEATGKSFVETKARGTVRIYNNFNTAPQTLIANTRFLTDAGKLYRLPKGVTVPPAKMEGGKLVAQYIETELVADAAGEGGNLAGEVRLSIPGFQGSPRYKGFYALAPAGFSGGMRGESPVVSADDVKRAEEQVTKKVFDAARRDLVGKTPPDFALVEAFREIQITELKSPKAGTPGARFSVSSRAAARALVFRESDVTALLNTLVIGEDATRSFLDGSADLRYRVRSISFEKGRADAVLEGGFKTKRTIAPDAVKGLIAGKKREALAGILKGQENIASFTLNLFPPWRSSAPSNLEKIEIVIQNPGAGQ